MNLFDHFWNLERVAYKSILITHGKNKTVICTKKVEGLTVIFYSS
jgi:hypothetical protein